MYSGHRSKCELCGLISIIESNREYKKDLDTNLELNMEKLYKMIDGDKTGHARRVYELSKLYTRKGGQPFTAKQLADGYERLRKKRMN